MIQIKALLKGVSIEEIINDTDTSVSSICTASSEAVPDCLFVAVKGVLKDGHEFIADAILKGAKVIVCEKLPPQVQNDICYIRVLNTRSIWGSICHNFFENPSTKLTVVGVTGTNGKTTTATLLYELHQKMGFKSALISTVENKIGDEVHPAGMTTPDAYHIASLMKKALDENCTHVFMECSSHGIDQDRIAGIHFKGAIFTNLTHDHLIYHKTMESYAQSKKKLFDSLSSDAFALVNADDQYGELIIKDTAATKYTYGLDIKEIRPNFLGTIKDMGPLGMSVLVEHDNTYELIQTKLVGKFNAYNILEIYGATVLLHKNTKEILKHIESLSAPRGRLELVISPDHKYAYIDYAHTPDALLNVLTTLAQVKKPTARIISVCGCGGNADKTKRPIMGNISFKNADYSIFTSDNPRDEKAEDILDQMIAELPTETGTYEVVVSRSDAIQKACAIAKPEDIILIAGKGHEDYQIIGGKKSHFSDIEEVEKIFSTK